MRQIDKEFFVVVDPEAFSNGLEDSGVGLVRDDHVDIVGSKISCGESFPAAVNEPCDRVLVRFITPHVDVMQVFSEPLGSGRELSPATGNTNETSKSIVVLDILSKNSTIASGGSQNHCTRSITEENTSGSVGHVDNSGEKFCSDQEDMPGLT